MEGFWTVEFQGVDGWGTGVATLIGGQVFGGDQGYLYTGSYIQNGSNFSASVHVKDRGTGIANVMGRPEFDLELRGLDMVGAARPKKLIVEGRIPGTELTIKGTLTKQSDLPPRS